LLVGVSLVSFFAAAACRVREERAAPGGAGSLGSASAEVASTPSPPAPGTLPEDPVAGARSVAQWREHLEREERERRLGYDRRKLREHREVLKTLRSVRRSYDGAATKRAVSSAEDAFRQSLPKLAAKFDEIDHYGVSSKVLPDYRELVATFSDAYPNARIAALAGDTAALARLTGEVDARFSAIDAWLREAADSEHE
jgi:hypothetical protein